MEEKVQAVMTAMDGYDGLKYPKADVDCETLRVFAIELGSVALRTRESLQALSASSKNQSDRCRAHNKEKFEPRIKKRMITDIQETIGPLMARQKKRIPRSTAEMCLNRDLTVSERTRPSQL